MAWSDVPISRVGGACNTPEANRRPVGYLCRSDQRWRRRNVSRIQASQYIFPARCLWHLRGSGSSDDRLAGLDAGCRGTLLDPREGWFRWALLAYYPVAARSNVAGSTHVFGGPFIH